MIYDYFKVFFDILISILLFFLLLPVFLLVSILIRIESPGSVFFYHERIGRNQKTFLCIKFRTMYKNSEKSGKFWTDPNDDRITKVGYYLRKYSIDELPQLINVIKNEISLVGPRPDHILQKSDYKEYEINKRCSVKPGITGLSQVSGRSNLTFEQRKKFDLEYVDNYSFLLDIKILFKTFLQLFKGNSF